jgi:RNA polymerase sigma-70 factor, ECF subfamily
VTPRRATAPRPDDVDMERDRALVERCQRGDTSAFDDLYLRYYARLCRFCLRKLHDPVEAEDTAQEAFARAWRALPTFNGERRFYPWLSVIASNLCVDLVRRKMHSTPADDEALDLVARPVEGGQEAHVEGRTDRELLVKAMGRLSPRYQEVLELREGREWSYQRIAQHKGVEISTVETLLYRARRSLRREFLLLSDGRVGLAGFLVVLAKLVRYPHNRVLRLARSGAHLGAGAPAAAASSAGFGLVPIVAGAVAVSAFAVVATLGPHAAHALSPAAARAVSVLKPTTHTAVGSSPRRVAGAGHATDSSPSPPARPSAVADPVSKAVISPSETAAASSRPVVSQIEVMRPTVKKVFVSTVGKLKSLAVKLHLQIPTVPIVSSALHRLHLPPVPPLPSLPALPLGLGG